MRTYLSKHFSDAMGRLLSKVEFEEDVYHRDPRGRFAPKEGGGVADWMSGRADRDIERQNRLDSDKKVALEKVGALIGKTVTARVADWSQFTEGKRMLIRNRYIKEYSETNLKRHIENQVNQEEIAAIGRQVLEEIGFPKDKIVLIYDRDIEESYHRFLGREKLLADKIYTRTGMKYEEAKKYAEDFFGKIKFKTEEEVNRRINSESGKAWGKRLEMEGYQSWNDSPNESKLRVATNFGFTESQVTLTEPKEYKVTEDGDDYKKTGQLGNLLAAERFKDIAKERGLEEPKASLIPSVWTDWKDSSTSPWGMRLQHAASEELGANSRLPKEETSTFADEEMAQLKAYARAQWEVSQFLMTKAGKDEIPVFRAVFLPNEVIAPEKKSSIRTILDIDPESKKVPLEPQTRKPLPDLRLQQNGVSSWTCVSEVANAWRGVGDIPRGYSRVILRARIPSTAVFSLPVHGQNVEEEQEVVVAGTPWKAWDAWQYAAPEFDKVPIEKEAPGLLAQGKAKAKGFVIDLNDPKITSGKKHWLTQKQATNPKSKKG